METSGEEWMASEYTLIGIVYFWIGFVFGLTSSLLIIGAIIGMCWRNAPRAFGRTIEVVARVNLITSTLIVGANVLEVAVAYAGNKYELFTFLRFRFGAYPLIGFAFIYWLAALSALAPQLFWWARFRRRYLAVLLIALITSFGTWYERLVILITSHADFIPSSWQ